MDATCPSAFIRAKARSAALSLFLPRIRFPSSSNNRHAALGARRREVPAVGLLPVPCLAMALPARFGSFAHVLDSSASTRDTFPLSRQDALAAGRLPFLAARETGGFVDALAPARGGCRGQAFLGGFRIIVLRPGSDGRPKGILVMLSPFLAVVIKGHLGRIADQFGQGFDRAPYARCSNSPESIRCANVCRQV